MPKQTKEWRSVDWLIKNYLSFLEKYGMSEESIRKYFEIWQIDKKQNGVNDFLWSLFNQLLIQVVKYAEDELTLHTPLADIYLTMTMFQRLHEKKPGNHTYQQYLLNQLELDYFQSRLASKVVCMARNCCSYCDSLNGLEMPIEVVRSTPFLSSEHCTRAKGCHCFYHLRPMRDENDRLIRKRKL